MSYADQKEASPSLGAANSETVATFVGSWEAQRSGLIRRQKGMRPRRPWVLRTAKLLHSTHRPILLYRTWRFSVVRV